MGMRVTLALLSFVFATGEAWGQALSHGDAGPERFDVAQNSARLSTASFETRVLVLSPRASTRPGETHAALALSNTSFAGDLTFRGRVKTVRQLRSGSPPNPWECAWIVWNYQADRFYYVAIKSNGWEIGKHDRAYRGNQRFLRTGEAYYAIGEWHDFEITQRQNEISVRIDDIDVASFVDLVRPYTSGKFGFYTEDAEIQIGDITAPFNEDFGDYPLDVHRGDGHVVKNWFMPFLGHGYAAIATAKR
jgi:hypothetical protein